MTTPGSKTTSADPITSSWAEDPLNYIVRVFAGFLQTIWDSAPRGSFHWSPSLEETEIVITEENPIHMEVIEKRPAIALALGPMRFNGSSLDDLVTITGKDSQETHTDLIPGTMTLNCISRVPHEARFIAWQTARTIWTHRKVLLRDSCFQELGRNISIGAVTPAGALVDGDTEGDWHLVALSIPFFFQWTDTVMPIKKDWKGVVTAPMGHATGQIRLSTITTRPPSINGRVLNVEESIHLDSVFSQKVKV